MKVRNVAKTISGKSTVDGAGVKLVRVLGHRDVEYIDPFLMLDVFDSNDPEDYIKGFPLHPHRGIETFTYLISGRIDHKDTLGNSGVIRGGEGQWMNSGNGILHEEMPQVAERLFGFQLWINLPKAHKMTTPTYGDLNIENMPIVLDEGNSVRVVAGSYKNKKGPEGEFVKPTVLDVTLKPDGEFSFTLPEHHTLFVYVLIGSGIFGSLAEVVEERTSAIFDSGDSFHSKAGKAGVRFILFSGEPLKEPIAWAGPIVMNTREELQIAFEELNEGTFIKHKAKNGNHK